MYLLPFSFVNSISRFSFFIPAASPGLACLGKAGKYILLYHKPSVFCTKKERDTLCTSFFSAFHIPQQMNIVYLNYFVKFPSTKIDLQIAFFDPSFRPHELSDRPVHDDRKDDAKKQKTDPVHRSDRISFRHLRPAGDDADRTDHAGGSHTGGHRRAVISELKYAGSDGTENHGGEHRRNPENRFFHQVRNLKHRGTESLRHKAPDPVVRKAQCSKTEHVGAAADCSRTPGKCQTIPDFDRHTAIAESCQNSAAA